MFVDARTLSEGIQEDCDICVVGAGAAGLSLVVRLRATGLKVLILESGKMTDGAVPGDLGGGTSNHADYPFVTSRARAFGGTTKRWAGACIPLDAADFERRAWVPNSGWPIGLDDLAQYYRDAEEIFGMVPANPFEGDLKASPLSADGLETRIVQLRKLDLGQTYRRLVAKARSVTCWLNATATELDTDGTGARVTSVTVRTPTGKRLTVHPRAVVLASGGLETPRLMLASNTRHPAGLGNAHDMVGRFHMEHPIRSLAVLPIADHQESFLPFTNQTRQSGSRFLGTFGVSQEVRAQRGLLDLQLRLYRYHPLEDDPAVVAAKALARVDRVGGSERPWAIGRSVTNPSSLPRLGRYLAWHYSNKIRRNARFDHVRLMAFVEQEPDPENRVTLSRQTDGLGQALPHLDYRESALMEQSIRDSLSIVSGALARRGYPGLRFAPEEVSHLKHYTQYGLHHMGSTRMAESPTRGVVDRDCRVFGVPNLFVASSSVFATGGSANPTLTISALALRLADHLAGINLKSA